MHLRRAAGTLGLLVIAACQPAPTEAPSSTPSPGPMAFALVGTAPVVDPADYGAAYLLPGATAVQDGTMHLWTVAFFADPSERPRLLHLVSTDGSTWSGDPDASAMEDFAIELDGPGPVPSTAFVDEGGTWVMHGGGRLPGGTDTILWRATAPGPDGPWTADPEPILEPSSDGWDNALIDHPSVVATVDGYLLAYGGAASAAPNRNRIGFATSTDGLTWTRVDADLDGADDGHALGPDACGIDARTMVEPHLISVDGGLLMVFGVMAEGSRTEMQIVTATSTDGRTWTCASGAETLGSDDMPDGRDMHSFAVIDHPDGPPSLLIELLGDNRSELWLARAVEH